MPKVSFRMAVSLHSLRFDPQTSTARKNHRSDPTAPPPLEQQAADDALALFSIPERRTYPTLRTSSSISGVERGSGLDDHERRAAGGEVRDIATRGLTFGGAEGAGKRVGVV